MKISTACLIGMLTIAQQVSGQPGGYEWAYSFGNLGFDEGQSIVVDDLGNSYVSGHFSNTVDFDPGTSSRLISSKGDFDIFLAKYDASGSLIWAHGFGDYGQDVGKSIYLDSDKNIYLTGRFDGDIDFDPDTSTYELTNGGIFICKYNSDGQFIWAKRSVGFNGNSIAHSNSNSIYTAGGSTFINKYSGNGNVLWEKPFTGTATNEANEIAVNSLDHIVLVGYFFDTLDCNPGVSSYNLVSKGAEDIFICSMDSNGVPIWAHSLGGSTSDGAESVITDANNNIYVTGYFSGTVDFDPGIGTHILTAIGGNEKDMFILKLNQNGNFLWVKQYGDSGGDQGFFLTKDENSDIYVSGYINSESFMAQVDPDETEDFIWKVEFIGPGYVSINSISLNKDGMLLSTGGFHDMADFDPGSGLYILTSQGNRDIFIHKLNERTVGVDEKTVATSIRVYPNPTNDIFTIDFGENKFGVLFKLMDTKGALLDEKRYDSADKIKYKLTGKSGMYFISITDQNSFTSMLRVVKTN